MAILRNDTTVRSADGQTTSAIITSANIGNYGISTTSTYYIGTTQNVFNRASGAQTLTGVSIDGNAANITAYTINQNLGTSNTPSFAGLVSSAITNYAFLQVTDTNNFWITPGNNNWGLYFETSAGGLLGGSGDSNRLGFVGAGAARFYVDLNNGNGWFGASLTANTDSRSPIFYDSNNTAYYIDPASTSIVNSFKVYDALYFGDYTTYLSQATPYLRITTANGYGNFGPANSSWFHMTTDRPNFYMAVGLHVNGDIFVYNTQSQLTSTSVRAPIFYDSGNTSYYLDPANSGTSLLVAGSVGIGTTSPVAKLHVIGTSSTNENVGPLFVTHDFSGTHGYGIIVSRDNSTDTAALSLGADNSNNAIIAANNGDLRIGKQQASTLYEYVRISTAGNVGIGTTSPGYKLDVNGSFRTAINNLTIFNDYIYVSPQNQNTLNSAYNTNGVADMWINFRGYNDGQTQFRNFNIGDGKGANIAWFDGTNKRMSINNGQAASYGLHIIGTGFASADFRAPIFYDSDNTAFYIDPTGSTSINVNGYIISSGTGGNKGAILGNLQVGYAGTYNTVQTPTNADTIWLQYSHSGNVGLAYGGGYTTAYNSIRSPIFYDSDDTTYYLDPASTTLSLKTRGYITITNASAPQNLAMLNIGYNGSGETRAIDIQGGWSGNESKSITFTHASTSTNIVAQINAQHNGPGSRLRWGKLYHSGDSSTYTMELISESTTSAYLTVAGSVRSPIFYDSGDTNYYLDPAGTSRLNTTRIGNINVGSGTYLNTITPIGDTNINLSAPSGAFYFDTFPRMPGFYDSADTTYYIDPASTSRIVALWVRGSSETVGNIYVGGSSAGDRLNINYDQIWTPNGNLHLQYSGGGNIDMNFGGGHAFSRTSLRAPIFYDFNNTAFYTDPASTSVLNRLTIDGGNYAFDYFQSFSDFTSGTLVTTDIPATAAEGESFVMNVVGKSYSTSTSPFNFSVQGYLYNSTIISYSGLSLDSTSLTTVKIFENGGVLCFWWPTITYWNAFEVSVRAYNSAKNNYNRVTNITNSTEPTGTKKVTVTLQRFLRADVAAVNSVNLQAPIFYDSNDTTYYTDPSSLSNILELKTNKNWYDSSASAWGGGINMGGNNPSIGFQSTASTWWYMLHHSSSNINFYRRSTSGSWNHDGIWDSSGNLIWQGSSVRAPIFYDQNNTAYYLDPNSGSNLYDLTLSGAHHVYLTINPGNGYEAMVRYIGGTGSSWYVGKRTSAQLVGTANFHFYSEAAGATVGGIDTSGNIYSIGSVRSPIFYDSDNTAYYTDPASTSVLNRIDLPSGSATINTTTPGQTVYQLNFTGQSTNDNAQAITWGWSTSGAQAGIYVQSSGGYGTKMYIATTDSFAIGSKTALTIDHTGVITTNRNYLQATGSLRAPIFYDSDNTAYYVDPASTSNLNGLTVAGGNATIYRDLTINGGTSGNFGNRIIVQGTATTYTLQDTNLRPTVYLTGAYPVLTLNHTITNNANHGPTIQFAFNGLTTGGSTSRQIVVGPNGTGTCLDFGFSGGGYGSNSDYNPHNGIAGYSGVTPMRLFSNGLLLGSTGAYPNNITSTSYALDVRGTGYASSDFRSPVFYDSDNTAYYANPAGTSIFNELVFGSNITIRKNNDRNLEVQGGGGSDSGIIGKGSSGQFAFQVYGSGSGSYGFLDGVWAGWDIRKVVDGDLFLNDNNSYYLNPASTSLFNATRHNSVIAGSTSAMTSAGQLAIYSASSPYISFHDGGVGRTAYMQELSGRFYFGEVTYTESEGSFRAPIFYDSNNTAYYIDAASTSVLNTLTILGDANLELYKSQTVDMSNTTTYSTSNYYPVTISVPTEGCIIQIQNNLNSNVPSWSTHPSGFTLNLKWRTNGSGWGTTAVRRIIDQYAEVYANQTICGGITQMTNSSIEVVWLRGGGQYLFKFSRNLSATAQATTFTSNSQSVSPTSTAQNTVWNAYSGYEIKYNNQTVSTDNMYTPVLYDWNNSSYYVDPASTSNLVGLTVANTITGSVSGNAATATLATKATRANGNFYIDDNYGNTVVGLYAANRYQGVFAMGDSYKLPADGTTTGNLYGIAWSHPNAGGAAGNLSTHGALILENGSYIAAISSSIRCTADMRTPIYYDSNNTAYYSDPGSTSRLVDINIDQGYTYGWWRNWSSGNGIYNQGSGQHFYSDDVSYWNVASSSGAQGIRFRTGGHGGTVRGYVYANDSNDVGLLNNAGNWRVRVVGGDYVLFDGSSARAQIFYDSNNTAYYVDPASTSILNAVRTRNTYGERIAVNASSPITIDTQYSVTELTLIGSISSMSFSNIQASGIVHMWTIVTVGNATAYTITWPAAVKWPGGTAPTVTTANTKRDIYQFVTYDGGTNIYAIIVGQNL